MPYGTINADLMTTSDGVSSSGLYGFKNRILNGQMVIDQRNAGASVTVNSSNSNPNTLDRFAAYNVNGGSGTFTQQQSTTVPAGFVNSLLTTVGTADTPTGNVGYSIYQRIEGLNISDLGWGTADASTVTLSFWVRSSITGNFPVLLQNSAYAVYYASLYNIPTANTWTKISITITGPTTGTWLTTNGIGIDVNWGFGAGSGLRTIGTTGAWATNPTASVVLFNVTGATQLIGTSGATFYITGVQLEKGSTATSFDYRPFGTELQLCQRYYQQINGNSFVGTTAYGMIGSGMVFTTTQADISIPLKVSMRATPTISQSTTTIQVGGALYASTGIGDAGSTPNVIFARISNAGTMTAGYGANFLSNNNTAGYFAASAEL